MPDRLSIALGAALLLILYGLNAAWLQQESVEQLVQRVPDDAFYYLVLAQEHALNAKWSFDGVSTATGFHLLHGYVLEGLYSLCDDWSLHQLVGVFSALSGLLMTLAFVALAAAGRTMFGAAAIWGAFLVCSSALIVSMQPMLIEMPWAFAATAGLVWWITRENARPSFGGLAGAAGLGLLANLARSDFGLLPAALVVVAWATRGPPGVAPQDPRLLRYSLAALLGAGVGVLLLLLHNHSVAGQWIQSSAWMKRHWTDVLGCSVMPCARLVGDLATGPWRGWLPVGVLMFALALAGWIRARHRWSVQAHSVLAAAWLSIAGYLLFYRSNGGVQDWYVVHFAPAATLVLGAGWAGWFGGGVAARWGLPIGAVALAAWGISGPSRIAPYPHQTEMLKSGRYLRDRPELMPVGCWNAGIVRYFSELPVINLDGLVNDDIARRIPTNELVAYAEEVGIRHVLDFDAMLTVGWLTARGGYPDEALRKRLRHVATVAAQDSALQWMESPIELYAFEAQHQYALGREILFGRDGRADVRHLAGGWAQAEGWGRWSLGPRAVLRFHCDDFAGQALVLRASMIAFVPEQRPRQRARLLANGEPVAELHFDSGNDRRKIELDLPKGGADLELVLEIEDPKSPADLGMLDDHRAIAIGIDRLVIRRAP